LGDTSLGDTSLGGIPLGGIPLSDTAAATAPHGGFLGYSFSPYNFMLKILDRKAVQIQIRHPLFPLGWMLTVCGINCLIKE